MTQVDRAELSASEWRGLYRAGGVAALIAGILFRRNLGAELSLFSPQKPPVTVADSLALLQTNRLLGLAYLNVFDLVNYVLVGIVFLALYVLLRNPSRSAMSVALLLGLLGITAYLASNTALSMLALSEPYLAATSETEKNVLLAAGQGLLALNRFGVAGHPGSGGYLSLLLIASAGMIVSVVILRGAVFTRAAAYVGILASAFDLAYCLVFAFAPGVDSGLLAVLFIPAAGLFWMVWHILIGIRLLQLGRFEGSWR